MLVAAVLAVCALASACSGGSNNISAITALPSATQAVADASATSVAALPSTVATITLTTEATLSQLEGSATAATINTVTPFVVPTGTLIPVEAAPSTGDTTTTRSSGSGSRFPTPNPYNFAGLAPGEAREIARATDVLMMPTAEQTVTFDQSPVPITFGEFYDGFDLRRGLLMSNKLVSLDGQAVTMEGYVAPPLKPKLDFFVLTRIPLAFCPFCSSDVEWPTDIALIYLPDEEIISSAFPVRITGRMEIGSSIDAETGMVSIVRIYADTVEVMR